MKAVVTKLKSKRGASIIIALLVLLICITAGAAALTAASANAGRYTHMAQDQQRYLAVASAAKLVRGELCGQSFTATAVLKENPGADTDKGELPIQLQLDAGSYTGEFRSWLEDDLNALFQATAVPVEWLAQAGQDAPDVPQLRYTGLTLSVEGRDELKDLEVKWSLELEEDYALKAKFWLEEDGATYYPTTLDIPAQVAETLSEPKRVTAGAGQRWETTKSVSVTWDLAGAVITQG